MLTFTLSLTLPVFCCNAFHCMQLKKEVRIVNIKY